MKAKAERLSASDAPVVGEYVRLRIEDLNPRKILFSSLLNARLKFTPLPVKETYTDPYAEDIELVTKVDFIQGGLAEGDIVDVNYVTAGGGQSVSAYTHEVEIVSGYERSVEVKHSEPIEEGDPEKKALFLFVKEAMVTEDGIELSDEEAWRIANTRRWVDTFHASPLKSSGSGLFRTDFALRNYFEYLHILYTGKNFLVDALVSKWLPTAEKLARLYKRLPEEAEEATLESTLRDLWDYIFGDTETPQGFDIHEYIPKKGFDLAPFLKELFQTPTTMQVIGRMPTVPTLENPYKEWLRLIHLTLRLSSSLTLDQLLAFEEYYPVYGSGPLEDLKYLRLLNRVDALAEMVADPMKFLSKRKSGSKNALQQYGEAGDEELDSGMLELVGRINALPADVVDLYKKSGQDSDVRLTIEEKLKGTNVTLDDLDRFERDFKVLAVSKAFQMLKANETVVNEEIKKYEDPENLNALADTILSKQKDLRKANKLLDQTLKFFRLAFPIGRRQALSAYYDYDVGKSFNTVREELAAKYGLTWSRVDAILFLMDSNYVDYDFQHLAGIEGFIREFVTLFGRALQAGIMFRNLKAPVKPLNDFEEILLAAFIDYDVHGNLVANTKEDSELRMDAFMQKFFPGLKQSRELYNDASAYYTGEGATYTRKDNTEITFQVLKDLTFNYARLSQFSKDKIKEKIPEELQQKKANVDTVRGYLIGDQNYIWEMGPVLQYAQQKAGILADTNTANLVQQHVKETEQEKMWTSISIGALSLVLGIAGFFTGGTTWGGLALLAGSVVLSGIDFAIEYNRFQFGTAVSNTALKEADELGNLDMNYLGVGLAFAGLVFDFATIAKAINQFYKVSKAVAMTADDAARIFDDLLKSSPDALKKVGGGTLTKQEFVRIFEEAAKKYGPGMVSNKSFQEFVSLHNIAPTGRPGLFALLKADEKAFESLKALRGFHADALSNIGVQLTVETRLTDSVAETVKFFEKAGTPNATVDILNLYGGPNSKFFGNLPDLWKQINASDASKYPLLVETILKDSALQAKILEDGENLALFVKRWESWSTGTHSSKSFKEFLQTGRTAMRFDKPAGKTIAEAFANEAYKLRLFASPGMFREKNIALLELTEPDLAKSLREGTFLPENTQLTRELNEVLNKDLIGTTTDAAYARGKVVAQINETIAKNVDITELRGIRTARLPGEPASMGSIFEGWMRKNYSSIGGRHSLKGKQSFKGVQGQATTSKDIVFDDHYLPNDKTFVGVEFKSGDGALSGEDLQQSLRYGELARNPALTKTGTHAGYDNVFVEYIFLSEDAARKSVVTLRDNIPIDQLRVFYIDNAGKMIQL